MALVFPSNSSSICHPAWILLRDLNLFTANFLSLPTITHRNNITHIAAIAITIREWLTEKEEEVWDEGWVAQKKSDNCECPPMGTWTEKQIISLISCQQKIMTEMKIWITNNNLSNYKFPLKLSQIGLLLDGAHIQREMLYVFPHHRFISSEVEELIILLRIIYGQNSF